MKHSFSSYDEPLGPHTSRYFGDGYKNVGREFTRLALSRSNQLGAKHSGRARLTYPAGWSTKREGELVPHVSSVDTVMLAAALCDAAVARSRELSAAESARSWVRHATVRAGASPHEDLADVPVTAEVVGASDTTESEIETTFKFQVGPLNGTLSIVHPPGSGAQSEPGLDEFDGLAEIFGPAPHYYLNGLVNHTLTASELTVDETGTRITGQHRITPGQVGGFSGAESAYSYSSSPIDSVVGAAQSSQILLYHLDSLTRANSNTLWMRKLEFITAGPHRPIDDSFEGILEIRRASIIDRGGSRWRSADIQIKAFNGVTGSCLLAHQLPE
ncbi:AvrD family protein [Nocardia brasiliensis]|uniref:AvrD family protein n=1 Tax=Nocardia brasiliensis TaxID=37326 RepID=UPI0024547BCE|nr:AvrD family protein [Nocardia brasiliensis]